MARTLVVLFAGLLFGAGLALGGMTDPARVQGFLDLFGQWDPTLAFVMGGAVLVMALAWIIRRRLERPLLDERFFVPEPAAIDGRLIAGSILFGIGWGLAGLCPGPAFAAVPLAPVPLAVFLVAMFVGMALHRFVIERERS